MYDQTWQATNYMLEIADTLPIALPLLAVVLTLWFVGFVRGL